jgi:hypothetical protein
MAFNGDEGSIIPLEEGITMTSHYRKALLNKNKGVFIGRELLQELLQQDGAMGIRFYFGLDEGKNLTLVLAAANSEESDILAKVGNRGSMTPPHSDVISPLFESAAVAVK